MEIIHIGNIPKHSCGQYTTLNMPSECLAILFSTIIQHSLLQNVNISKSDSHWFIHMRSGFIKRIKSKEQIKSISIKMNRVLRSDA